MPGILTPGRVRFALALALVLLTAGVMFFALMTTRRAARLELAR